MLSTNARYVRMVYCKGPKPCHHSVFRKTIFVVVLIVIIMITDLEVLVLFFLCSTTSQHKIHAWKCLENSFLFLLMSCPINVL